MRAGRWAALGAVGAVALLAGGLAPAQAAPVAAGEPWFVLPQVRPSGPPPVPMRRAAPVVPGPVPMPHAGPSDGPGVLLAPGDRPGPRELPALPRATRLPELPTGR